MIGCIIQARMGSKRFPGKILRKLDEKNTILDYVINQSNQSKKLKKIVVATTKLKKDDIIEKKCKNRNISCFRGSVDDVLDRYYQCANEYSFDPIVRITSDNPMIDPEIIDLAIEEFEKGKYDMVTTCNQRSYPHGISVEIFSLNALKESWEKSKLLSEREHVVLYIQNIKNKFRVFDLIHSHNLTHINCTIDNKEDYALVKKIVEGVNQRPILMEHIVKLFEKNPELLEINKNSDPYEGHKKSFEQDKLISNIK